MNSQKACFSRFQTEGICPEPLPEDNPTRRLQSGGRRSMLHQRY
jgi:hypothetical protein